MTLLYDPQRVARAMDEAGIDVLLATTTSNVQYLTRYRKPGAALAAVRRSDPSRPTLIVPSGAVDFVLEDDTDGIEVLVYGTFYRAIAEDGAFSKGEALVADLHRSARTDVDQWGLLREVVGGTGVIGADSGLLPPALEVRDVAPMFRRLRSIKTADEIARLAEVAKITEDAIGQSAAAVAPGVTQRELARVFRHAVTEADAWIRSDNVSIDGGAALGNVNVPTDAVRDGSVVRYDVGAFHAGYASDISRCFVFRTASPKVAHYHAALVAGQDRALAALRPGVKASEVFRLAVSAVRDAGIPHYERTHVGHGIGIAGAGYDPPLLAPGDDTALEAGMVLCVETPYYDPGFTGLQVEDMVVVSADGYRALTRSRRDLLTLP